MLNAAASVPLSEYVSLSSSMSSAATASPTLSPARVFSSTVRAPLSVDGNVGRWFSPKTRSVVIATALFPLPRVSSYSTLARRKKSASASVVV